MSPAIAIRVSPELKRRAEKAAARAGVSVSALARQALEQALQG
ncbi:MAG: toxin-antitoxin system HicB family antitoxin [Candidatus Nanopelagicales bacterium]|nr:toxin-antitoxin system HicB family antitoxin [Candidatus Nanopelagicales bacterium]MCF8541957.1 toxin-antitoxin system HicB family antitoxin [Candidatus Nanopelagicales bacterium]MCF8557764.1 toxin-antitoxin system HicB family antitoxin [Candidatus Nanopelagicales bacterium]